MLSAQSFVRILLLSILILPVVSSKGLADDSFQFTFDSEGVEAVPGKPVETVLNLKMKEKDAYVHPEAPFQVRLSGDGLRFLGKRELRQADGVREGKPEKARSLAFTIPFETEKRGKNTLRAQVNFYFCTPKLCIPKEAEAKLQVHSK